VHLFRVTIFSLLVSAWLSLEFWVLGSWSWIYGYGASLETIPTYLGLSQTSSTFALWAPFVAGGVDRLSFWGNADPLNLEALLFTWFPVWGANGLHAFLQRFVAILFTALVLREQLGASPRAAALGGILHGCFSYYTVGAMFTSPAVPLFLWAVYRLQSTRFVVVGALALGAAVSTLTTFAHGVPYLAVFAFGWFIVVLGWRNPRQLAGCLVAVVTLTVFELHQTIALLYNAPFSMRAVYAAESLDFSLAGLFYYQPEFDFFNQDPILKAIAIFAPPAILIAGSAAALAGRGTAHVRSTFWRIALLYALLSAKFLLVAVQRLASNIAPWIDGVYMGRLFMVPYPFLVAALTVTASQLVMHARPAVRRWLVLAAPAAIVVFMLVWPKVALWRPLMIDSWGQQHYEVAALDALKASDRGLFRVASVLDLQPAYAYAQGLEAADGWSNLYPRVYRELWLRVLAPLFQRLPRNRDIFAPATGRPQDNYIFLGSGLITPGLGALPNENTARAVIDGFDVEQRFNMNLLSLLNVKYLLSEYPLRGSQLHLVHEPDPRPSAVISHDYATGLVNSARSNEDFGASLQHALERRRRGKEVFIYRNDAVLPRFRFVRRVEVLAGPELVLDALSAASIDDLRVTAFVEGADAPPLGQPAGGSAGAIAVAQYRPDEIVLSVDQVRRNEVLVASMTWNPFWTATINGRRLPVVRVNHAQFAVAIAPPGGRLVLRYEPPYKFLRPGTAS
jgi:hypothetical protein